MSCKKILAIDYGTKRIGLASGDTESRIAFPQKVILNKDSQKVFAEISEFCADWGVDIVVIGLPTHMNTSESEMTLKVRDFKEKLEAFIKDTFPEMEVKLMDERLSSFEADQLVEKSGMEWTQNKLDRDAFAAKIILERYFDTLKD